MSKISFIFVVVLAFLAGIAGAYTWSNSHNEENGAAKESAYERVMRTQTIKCGYGIWPPLVIRDPNTGKLSGIVHDYLEALGAALHLKIDWAEEIGWGDFPAALESGRVDGFCAGVWPNASRARQMDFIRPILYQPIHAYARVDDRRFDNNLPSINDPAVTLATMDGEMSSLIAAADFPKAKQVQLTQLSNGSELFTSLITGKADITFTDTVTAGEYEAKNPGKIRRIVTSAPVRVFGNTIAIARGQEEFRRMMDTVTEELILNGQIEKIISKYEQYPGALLRVEAPYKSEASR